jgi:hypothetical protein
LQNDNLSKTYLDLLPPALLLSFDSLTLSAKKFRTEPNRKRYGSHDLGNCKINGKRDKKAAGRLAKLSGGAIEERISGILRQSVPGFRPLRYGPDGIIENKWGRVYVEIKSCMSRKRVKQQLKRAFSRPERPLIVILAVLNHGAWIYVTPEKRYKFNFENLMRVLRGYGVIEW